MNKQLLTAVSVIALMAATPAMAETKTKAGASVDAEISAESERTMNQGDTPTVTTDDVKKGWEDTKDAVSDTAEDVSDATKNAYKDIKATLIGDEKMGTKAVTINSSTTASGMIGQPVMNGEERVGKIHDIILNRDGKATMVIVADGNLFGMGKLAAFDYGSMVKINANGDVIMPLSEASIDQAAEFSYDQEDYSSEVRVVPNNGYSAAKLLDAELVDAEGKTLANVDDIQFSGGSASHLIVGFDKILGLGGEKAAMAYGSADLVKDGDGYDFKLSAAETAQFKSYKKAATN